MCGTSCFHLSPLLIAWIYFISHWLMHQRLNLQCGSTEVVVILKRWSLLQRSLETPPKRGIVTILAFTAHHYNAIGHEVPTRAELMLASCPLNHTNCELDKFLFFIHYHASNIFIAKENRPKQPKTHVLPALNCCQNLMFQREHMEGYAATHIQPLITVVNVPWKSTYVFIFLFKVQ